MWPLQTIRGKCVLPQPDLCNSTSSRNTEYRERSERRNTRHPSPVVGWVTTGQMTSCGCRATCSASLVQRVDRQPFGQPWSVVGVATQTRLRCRPAVITEATRPHGRLASFLALLWIGQDGWIFPGEIEGGTDAGSTACSSPRSKPKDAQHTKHLPNLLVNRLKRLAGWLAG